MPLVKYAECQQPASTTAETCPNCGASVKRKSSFSTRDRAIAVDSRIFSTSTRSDAIKRERNYAVEPSPAESPALPNSKLSEPAAPPPPSSVGADIHNCSAKAPDHISASVRQRYASSRQPARVRIARRVGSTRPLSRPSAIRPRFRRRS